MLKDTDGNPLKIGALYCCRHYDYNDNPYFGLLVRYVGEVIFADADTWEEIDPEYDELVLQNSPAIDPKTKGW